MNRSFSRQIEFQIIVGKHQAESQATQEFIIYNRIFNLVKNCLNKNLKQKDI